MAKYSMNGNRNKSNNLIFLYGFHYRILINTCVLLLLLFKKMSSTESASLTLELGIDRLRLSWSLEHQPLRLLLFASISVSQLIVSIIFKSKFKLCSVVNELCLSHSHHHSNVTIFHLQ